MNPGHLLNGEKEDIPSRWKISGIKNCPSILALVLCNMSLPQLKSCRLREKNGKNAQRVSESTVCAFLQKPDGVTQFPLANAGLGAGEQLKGRSHSASSLELPKTNNPVTRERSMERGMEYNKLKIHRAHCSTKFQLNKHLKNCTSNCCKPLVNFQSSEKINFDHFCLYLLLLLRNGFWRSCLHLSRSISSQYIIFRSSLYKNKFICIDVEKIYYNLFFSCKY